MDIVISDFTQGGFYISNNEDYDSNSEIRSGWINLPYQPFKITIQTDYQWSFVCADNNGNFIQISESSGYKNGGYVVDLHSYSWIKKIRIELHNNDGISPPESCTFQELSPWFMSDDDMPTTSEFIDVPEKAIEKPYPDALWRIEDTEKNGYLYSNDGFAYNMLLPELKNYRFERVYQSEYITVHGHLTKQNDFGNNGLAVLQPLSCDISEELNGEYSLQIVLPVDEIGKWTYLKEMNYIKAMGQIFRINQVEYSESGKSQQVSANAVHCFYIWNDWAIEPKSRIQFFGDENKKTSMEALINGMLRAMWKMYNTPEQGTPKFTYTSDINDIDAIVASEKWGRFGTLQSVGTATELIMGNDGFIANFGGELYRNNFYFSINKKMENSDEDAFNIHIGFNLKGIKRKVDISTACTYLECRDNFGQAFAVSYTPASIAFIAHPITRRIDFQYDEPNMNLLEADTMKYWYQHGVPLISYTIDLEDVTDNSDFREFTGKPKYKVGNSGTIYDERLGSPIKLKITKTKTDAITGKVVSVTFGASRQFAGYNVNTQIVEYDVPLNKTQYMPLRDVRGRMLKTQDGYKLMKKTEE